MKPSEERDAAAIRAALARLARYDDESIRQVARALLVHPRPLPHQVTSVIAGPCHRPGKMSDPPATMGSGT